MYENADIIHRYLKKACEEKLFAEYSSGIPDAIAERHKSEFEKMILLNSLEELYVYHLLSKEASHLNIPIILCGTARCSLLVYLLGDSMINPMKAYYYCDRCGHFAFIEGGHFGIDAKEKFCPECGQKLRSEGFSLGEEFVWGTEDEPKKICFEYSVPQQFKPIAMQRLKELGKHHVQIYNSSILDRLYHLQQQFGLYLSEISQYEISGYTWRDITNTGLMLDEERKTLASGKPKTYFEMAELICEARSLPKEGMITEALDYLLAYAKAAYYQREDSRLYAKYL